MLRDRVPFGPRFHAEFKLLRNWPSGGCTPGDDWVSRFQAAKDDEDLRQSQHARCMCTSLWWAPCRLKCTRHHSEAWNLGNSWNCQVVGCSPVNNDCPTIQKEFYKSFFRACLQITCRLLEGPWIDSVAAPVTSINSRKTSPLNVRKNHALFINTRGEGKLLDFQSLRPSQQNELMTIVISPRKPCDLDRWCVFAKSP